MALVQIGHYHYIHLVFNCLCAHAAGWHPTCNRLATRFGPHMKKILLLLSILALCVTTHAGSYQYSTTVFRPDDKNGDDPDDVFDLDHHYAYTWGIADAAIDSPNTYSGLKNQLAGGSGWSIDSVKLTFKDIWDWVVEPNDRLWVNLLDTDYTTAHSGKDLIKGVTSF